MPGQGSSRTRRPLLANAVHEVRSRSHRNLRRRRLRLIAVDRHHRTEHTA